MKYLGIDYGKRKVGLAISEGELADGFKVIEVSGLADALERVRNIVKGEGIDRVVVGLPESGEAKNMVVAFVRGLREKGVDVKTVDETLSTKGANEKIRSLGLSRLREDALAAAEILQNYLDSLK